MKNKSILLFTKDALPIEYLPCYGNEYWKGKTPNIDELVEKGTLFTRFYTAAPSSAMAYMAMFTGKYPYEQNIKAYTPLVKSYDGETLFDKARKQGYDCHVMWDEIWMSTSYKHSLCYGKDTQFHSLNGLRQGVGFHYQHDGFLQPSREKEESTLKMIEDELLQIMSSGKIFLWFHLPHVINGRVGYGSDIDLHDRVLGIMRKYFEDENIYVSADHGNMNGNKGILGYGFHVYEPAIRIPLITPRKKGLKTCDSLLSNIDWDKILFGNDEIPIRDVVISDCAYYAQPNRKTAFICGKYRYIYNKSTKIEELYDVDWDPHQHFNLMEDKCYDSDRKVINISRELYFYPYWDDLESIREKMRMERDKIWREEDNSQKMMNTIIKLLKRNERVRSFCRGMIKIVNSRK